MPTDLQTLQQQIAAAENEKWQAQLAEQKRLEAENAARRKITEKDAELARMKAQAAQLQLAERVKRAQDLAGAERAAVLALRDGMGEAIDALLASLAAPLAAADLAFRAVIAANDDALAAGVDLSNYAPPAPPTSANGDAIWAEQERQERWLLESYGRARGALPAPLLPAQAALIGLSAESDGQRQRAWQALYYILTGHIVSVDRRYDPDQDANRAEKARTQPRRML